MSLQDKISFIQTVADEKFRLILNEDWNSSRQNYREQIRSFLEKEFSAHFSREQLVNLHNLNWVPSCAEGSVSISHCTTMGGFTLSQFKIGFDVEELKRISTDIVKRVSDPHELKVSPKPEFLWVAKEAAFKALSGHHEGLTMADFQASDWQSYFENQIFGFRMNSKKTLDFGLNKGFIFSEGSCLLGFFFK